MFSSIPRSIKRKQSSSSRLLGFETLDHRVLLTVTTVGDTVRLEAANVPNDIRLTMGVDEHLLTVDNVEHRLDAAEIRRILIFANGGKDSILVEGSAADERIEAYERSIELLSSNYIVRMESIEDVRINTGEGHDRVEFVDSAGDDEIDLNYRRATFNRSNGQKLLVTSHERVEALSDLGGNDVVHFRDSPGNDRFTAKHMRSYMSGDGLLNYARGFEIVNSESLAGEDEARLYDSPDDDMLELNGNSAMFKIDMATHNVNGFNTMRAYSSEGNDKATIVGNEFVTDVFVWEPTSSYMYSTGEYDESTAPSSLRGEQADVNVNVMVGFPMIEAIATDPSDRAELRGSSDADEFVGVPGMVELRSPSSGVQARDFRITRAFGRGGLDSAHLEDSPGHDRYVGRENYSYLETEKYLMYVSGFDTDAVARRGGVDRFHVAGYSGPEQDYLVQQRDRLMIHGPNRTQRLTGFDSGTVMGDNAGVVVFDPFRADLFLEGSHNEDDQPSDAVTKRLQDRIDAVFAKYELVNGQLME